MSHLNPQAPSAVIMVRPHHFMPNPETQSDNAFQTQRVKTSDSQVAKKAYGEFTKAAELLRLNGVNVHVFEDENQATPDSVFPNNWFSTHSGGHVAIYPMFAPNRRKERRQDIIEMLKREYRVQDVIDYSGLEQDGLYLEGTGAMVLDHIERVAYAIESNRTDPVLLERFCTHFNYEPMVFQAADVSGRAVYHTNVLMGIATEFVVICPAMITDKERRRQVLERLEHSGREIVAVTSEQIRCFAGNVIELTGANGRILALSKSAFDALMPEQIAIVEKSASLLPLDVNTIEMAGGSVRCMLAGIHLSRR